MYIGTAWSESSHRRHAAYTPVLTYDTLVVRNNYRLKLHRQQVAKSSTNFGILYVCKQINEEALHILYG